MIPNKYIAIGVVVMLIFAFANWVRIVVEERALYKAANEQSVETIQKQAKDAEWKDNLLLETVEGKLKLEQDYSALREKLKGLKLSDAHKKCYQLDLPAGYNDSVQQLTD